MYMHSRTYVAIPPGEAIKEQLEYQNVSQKDLSERMGMAEKNVRDLLNGDAVLTTDIAVKLEDVLGVPASFWNGLESSYRDKIKKILIENSMDEYKEMTIDKWARSVLSSGERIV